MASLGELVVSLTAETAQFRDALTKSAYQMEQTAGNMVKHGKSVQDQFARVDEQIGAFGVSLRSLFGLAAAGGFATLIAQSVESAAKMHNLSEQTGIMADQLAAMREPAAAAGLSLDNIAQASAKFSKAIETSSEDSKGAAQALSALGISMDEIKAKSPAEQMHLVAQRMNQFADGSGKAAAAQLLFGKTGTELLPFLKDYGDQVELSAKGFNEFAAQADAFDKNLVKLKASSQAVITQYAMGLMPALKGVSEGFLAMHSEGEKSLGFVDVLAESFRVLALGAATAWTAAKLFFDAVVTGAKLGYDALRGDFAGMREEIAAFRQRTEENIDTLARFSDKALQGSKVFGDTAQAVAGMGDAAAEAKPKLNLAPEMDESAKAAGKWLDSIKRSIDLLGLSEEAVKRYEAREKGLGDTADQLIGTYARKKAALEADKKAMDEARQTQERLIGDAIKFHDSLQKQIATLGLSAEAIAKLDAREKGLGDTEDEHIERLERMKEELAEQQDALKAAESAWEAYKAALERQYTLSNNVLASWAEGNAELERQIRTLGLTRAEVLRLAAASQYEADVSAAALLEDTTNRENYLAALKGQYQQRLALINSQEERQAYVDAAEAQKKAFDDSAKAIEKSLEDAFVNGFAHGKSIAESFKNWLINIFKNLVLRPILQPVSNWLAGMGQSAQGGMASMFGGGFNFSGWFGGSGSDYAPGEAPGAFTGSATGWAQSPMSYLGAAGLGASIASQYGAHSSAAGAMMGLGASVGLAGSTGLLATAAASVATAAGATAATAASVAAAVPVVGWIVAAAALIYSIFGSEGGGPKTGGSSFASFGPSGLSSVSRGPNEFYTPNQADESLNAITTGIGNSYLAFMRAIDATAASVTFGMGYDTDPQGTAQNRLGTYVGVNGQQVYGFRDLELGRDNAVLDARMKDEAQRMLLAAIQASELPDDVAALIDGLVPANLGAEQIQNALTFAAVFHSLPEQIQAALDGIDITGVSQEASINLATFGVAYQAVLDVINRNPLDDANAAIAAAGQTPEERFAAMGQALSDMAAEFDGSAASAVALAGATQEYYQAQVQLIIALKQAAVQFHNSITQMREGFRLDVMSPAQRLEYFQSQTQRLQGLMDQAAANPSAYSATQVQQWASQLQNYYQQWWSAMTPEQRAAAGDTFDAALGNLDEQVSDILNTIAENIAAQNDPNNPDSPIGQVKAAFDKFMEDMNQWLLDNGTATQAQAAAASQMATAASTMVQAGDKQLEAANTKTVIRVEIPGLNAAAEVGI